MIYVINYETDDGTNVLCICKANSLENAERMVGRKVGSSNWVCFNVEQVKAVIDCKEGFVSYKS